MKTNIKRKTTAIILGLLFSIILLEIGIRLTGFVFLSLQDYRNRLAIKQKGSYRILCLGDSMTAGMYPRPLKEILNERTQGIKFTVIDRGFPGTNSEYTITTLNENLYKYSPDMVIVMSGFNDGDERLPYGNISILNKMPFRTYKLAGMFWYHILNKIKKIGIPAVNRLRPLEEYEKTEEMLKKAIKINPRDGKRYAKLGYFYNNLGKFDKDEEILKKAIKMNLKDKKIYNGLGFCYMAQQKYAKAKEILKEAIKIHPKDDEAYVQLGVCYRKQGEYQKAEKMLEKAIQINPQNVLAYIFLAEHYQAEKKYDKSIEMFEKVIMIKNKNWKIPAYIGLSWCYRNMKKFGKAEEMAGKAIKIDIENDRPYAILGLLYEEQGKYKSAGEYFEKANTLRKKLYTPMTRRNYQRIKKALSKRKIKLVCMQYPMRGVEPLKKMLEPNESIIFIDNEKIFKEMIKQTGFNEYFVDNFGGDFGHCNSKGNRLLAENIANVILKEVFNQ